MQRPYYGWVIVLACFIGTFVIYGLTYSFGIFFEQMLEEFDQTRGLVSIAFGVQTFFLYAGASVIGIFIDRYGTRRILTIGAVLLCLGLLQTSQATSLTTVVFSYGIVMGIGMGIVYVISYATVPRWFSSRRGIASGVASAGLGVGMLAVVPTSAWLINLVGWKSAFLLLAVGTAFSLGVMILLIRDGPKSLDSSPPPDEFTTNPHSYSTRNWRDQINSIKNIVLSPSFLLLFVGWGLVYVTLFVVFAHLVIHTVDIGFSRAVGATAISIIGLSSAIGRIVIGYIGDTAGRVRIFVSCSATMSLSTMLLPLAHSTMAIFTFAAVYGIAYGGNGALLGPITIDLFGEVNLNAIFGLLSMSFAVVGLISPSLAGAGHDILGTYNPVFVVAGLIGLLGTVAVAAADSGVPLGGGG